MIYVSRQWNVDIVDLNPATIVTPLIIYVRTPRIRVYPFLSPPVVVRLAVEIYGPEVKLAIRPFGRRSRDSQRRSRSKLFAPTVLNVPPPYLRPIKVTLAARATEQHRVLDRRPKSKRGTRPPAILRHVVIRRLGTGGW